MSEQVTFNRLIMKSREKYLGFCPELNIAVSSDTPESATQALVESVQEFLKTAKEEKQLEIVLEEAGYGKKDNVWTAPGIKETGIEKVNV